MSGDGAGKGLQIPFGLGDAGSDEERAQSGGRNAQREQGDRAGAARKTRGWKGQAADASSNADEIAAPRERAADRPDGPPASSAVVPLAERRAGQLSNLRRIEQRLTVVPLAAPRPSGAAQASAAQALAASVPLGMPQPLELPEQTPPAQPPKTDPAADPGLQNLPPLPGMMVSRQDRSTFISFAVCVLLPVVVASIYYLFIASHQYVAEFRFTVKDTSQSSAATPTSLLSMIGGVAGPSTTENYVVADFLTSRQAAEELQKRIKVVDLYGRSSVDWLSRFNNSRPMEWFIPYWQKMVTASYDQVTGIAVAQVRAFSAEDALLIANSLVALSEELVNQISNRARSDAVTFAQREVDRAEARLRAIRAKLTDYRSRVGVIDPATSVVASNSLLIQTLRSNLATLETQVASLKLQKLQPNAPMMISLENQIRSTKEQIQAVEGTVGKGAEGKALSAVIAEYEQLDLERQFAQTMLAGAATALDQARAASASQHLYITPYVRPSLPQSAIYPRPFMSILTVAVLAFAFWVAFLMVMRSIRERFV